MDARNQILSNIRKVQRLEKRETGEPLFKKRNRDELLWRWKEIERRRARQREELVETFKRECESILGKVYVAENGDELRHCLSSILKGAGTKKIVKWDSPILERLEIDRLLDSLMIQNLLSGKKDSPRILERKDYLDIASKAELGLSGADYGVADTGTLVLRALEGQDRLASLLPPVHVAVLESERILFGSDDLILRLQLDIGENQGLDSCLTLITGPSKTADIELNLILGVHGPKDLHVIILKPT